MKVRKFLKYGLIHGVKNWLLMYLLKWWATSQMDQWERWRIKSEKGLIYVRIDFKGDGYEYDYIPFP